MNRLQLVEYPLLEVLFTGKEIGDKLGEEGAMLLPEVFYETDQRASKRAEVYWLSVVHDHQSNAVHTN